MSEIKDDRLRLRRVDDSYIQIPNNDMSIHFKAGEQRISMKANGEFWYNGRLVETDRGVYEAMKAFLAHKP